MTDSPCLTPGQWLLTPRNNCKLWGWYRIEAKGDGHAKRSFEPTSDGYCQVGSVLALALWLTV